ncbi:MAG: hypothetical protein AB7T17_11020 [Geobacter sp.]
MKDIEAEVGVKDIIGFYIKINDSARAKKDMAKLSAKDKATAFSLIAESGANREFKIEIARYFVNDLDAHIRRKAELLLEALVPGWVADPAASILQVLRSADTKGASRRNAAVRFLFGIVDADSLRITLMSLLSSRNRAHIVEIIDILEQYIDASNDENEQVKIFNASLDIVLSDEVEMPVKHHASNLLSVFFKKVATTSLGAHLKAKYIERQVEKAESVYRFLCSGTCGLTANYLDDLLRPLQEGGSAYQLKILSYFSFLLDKTWNEDDVDDYIDTWPESWEPEDLSKMDKVRRFRTQILKEVEELWELTSDDEVRTAIMAVVYSGHPNKPELLATVRSKLEAGNLSEVALDKLSRILHSFLKSEEPVSLKTQAANLLLFNVAGEQHHLAALRFLRQYVEGGSLNYAEQGSLATVMAQFAGEASGADEQVAAWYLVFLLDPTRIDDLEVQKQVLAHLRSIVEQEVVPEQGKQLMLAALDRFADKAKTSDKLKKAAAYLVFRLRNPGETPTWEKIEKH